MSPSHSSQQHSENVHSTLMVSQQLLHSQTNQHAGRATFICFSNKHTHTNSQLSQTAVWVPLNQRSIAGRETWKEQNCHNKLEGKSCVGARSHVLVLMRSTQKFQKGKMHIRRAQPFSFLTPTVAVSLHFVLVLLCFPSTAGCVILFHSFT